MATPVASLPALGTEPPCHGCGRPHQRGSLMTAYQYDDGEPAGWHCETCRRRYETTWRFDPQDDAKGADDA